MRADIQAMLVRAKARIDSIDPPLYSKPVDISKVRVHITPWAFEHRIPRFFDLTPFRAYTFYRTILFRNETALDENTMTHELTHIWQNQGLGYLKSTWIYLNTDYETSPLESQARYADHSTRS